MSRPREWRQASRAKVAPEVDAHAKRWQADREQDWSHASWADWIDGDIPEETTDATE